MELIELGKSKRSNEGKLEKSIELEDINPRFGLHGDGLKMRYPPKDGHFNGARCIPQLWFPRRCRPVVTDGIDPNRHGREPPKPSFHTPGPVGKGIYRPVPRHTTG